MNKGYASTMRTLVIGDIHGCLVALNRLLDAVHPSPDDLLITLGDYVDRGPDSRGVLNRLISLSQSHRLIALRGNHDELMLGALDHNGHRGWCMMGGEATLRSYAPGVVSPVLALRHVPAEHWHFLNHYCRDWHETESHIFVHGYVDPALPMSQQEMTTLRWKRINDAQPHVSGKTIICGHTAQREGLPINLGYAMCIDTCVYGGGWLTCLELETSRYWQANQMGAVRMGKV